MNILYYNNAFYATELGEWPKKPEIPNKYDLDTLEKNARDYSEAIIEALSHSIPIVEEDWEKVKKRLSILSLINGIIYKDTGIELREVWQERTPNTVWRDYFGPHYTDTEYRKVYRVKNKQQEK